MLVDSNVLERPAVKARARARPARAKADPILYTVIDIMRAMGVVPEKHLSWAVGRAVGALYRAEFGRKPDIESRTKTNGGGTHPFAVYPASWKRRIRQVIEKQVEIRK